MISFLRWWLSLANENVQLLGLDHPLIATYLKKFRELPPDEIGVRVKSPDGKPGILATWFVEAKTAKGRIKRTIVHIAVDERGARIPDWERNPERLFEAAPATDTKHAPDAFIATLHEILEPMLQRELEHRRILTDDSGYEGKLISWVEAM